jgi:hypothetical protein
MKAAAIKPLHHHPCDVTSVLQLVFIYLFATTSVDILARQNFNTNTPFFLPMTRLMFWRGSLPCSAACKSGA